MVSDHRPPPTEYTRKRVAEDAWGSSRSAANKRPAPDVSRSRSQPDGARGDASSRGLSNIKPKATSKELWHGQVCKIYASYSRLLRSSPSCPISPDAAVEAPPPSHEELQDFQRILRAASPEGSCANRRLASRLIPKFVPRFPSLVDACATALITLHLGRWTVEKLPKGLATSDENRSSEQEAIIRATREDALQGLGEVLHAAIKLVEKAVPTVLRIVDFLFRQLHACTTAGAAEAYYAPSFKCAHQQANSSPEPHPPPATNTTLAIIQEVLKLAFKLYPRVVLSCCLQSFKGQDRVMFQAATCFCKHTLLADSSRAPAVAAAAAAKSAVGGSKEGTPSEAAAEAKLPNRPCLAQEVLTELPDTQHWLRQAIVSIAKDKKVLSAKECHPHIDRLLKLSAPVPSPNASSPHPLDVPGSFTGAGIQGFAPSLKPQAAGSSCSLKGPSLGAAAWGLPNKAAHTQPPTPSVSSPATSLGAGLAGRGIGSSLSGANVWDDFEPRAAASGLGRSNIGGSAGGEARKASSIGGPITSVSGCGVHGNEAHRGSNPGGATAAAAARGHSSTQGLVSPTPLHPQARSGTPELPPLPPPSPRHSHALQRTSSQAGSSNVAAPLNSGTTQQQGHATPPTFVPIPSVLTPLAVRGGPVCRADSCLFLANLPVALNEQGLRAECVRHGITIDSLHMGQAAQLQPGEAFAVFTSVKNAAICAEALSQQKPFGGSRPLIIEFSPGLPLNCPVRTRAGPLRPASSLVWCSGPIQPAEIMGALRNTQAVTPTTLLKVSGHMPGFLLEMPQPECCQHVIDTLLAYRFPHGNVRAAPHVVPHSLKQAAEAAAAAPFLPPATAQPPLPPQPHAAGAFQTPEMPLSGASARTLWVGHIHPSVNEDQLLNCFRCFGEVVSHCVVRASSCAFIDFSAHASAAEAKRAMSGTLMGQPPQPIRVEWRSEPKGNQTPRTTTHGHAPGTVPRTTHHTSSTPVATPFTMPPSNHAPNSAVGTPHPPVPCPHLGARSPCAPPSSVPAHTPSHPGRASQGVPPTPPSHPLASATSPGGPAFSTPKHAHAQQQQQQRQQQHRQAIAGGASLSAAADAAVAAASQSHGAGHRAVWGGVLAKSGAPVCNLVCLEGPSATTASEARGSGGGFEPRAWPRTLDVRMRVDVQYVVNTVYSVTPPDARSVRWLRLHLGHCTPEDRSKLAEFSSYLANKGRAGVIKLDPMPNAPGSPAARGPLALYLVTPSSAVCASLGVPWDAHRHKGTPLLLALVVPLQPASGQQ